MGLTAEIILDNLKGINFKFPAICCRTNFHTCAYGVHILDDWLACKFELRLNNFSFLFNESIEKENFDGSINYSTFKHIESHEFLVIELDHSEYNSRQLDHGLYCYHFSGMDLIIFHSIVVMKLKNFDLETINLSLVFFDLFRGHSLGTNALHSGHRARLTRGHPRRFSASKPKDIDKYKLFYEGHIPCSVTPKADGIRMQLAFNSTSLYLVVNRQVCLISEHPSYSVYSGTVFDAELCLVSQTREHIDIIIIDDTENDEETIKSKIHSPTKKLILIFDCLCVRHSSTHDIPYFERCKIIEEFVGTFKFSNALFCLADKKRIIAEKQMNFFSICKVFLKEAKEKEWMYTQKDIEGLPITFKIDGLIFHSNKGDTYKWKPSNFLSIDFLIQFDKGRCHLLTQSNDGYIERYPDARVEGVDAEKHDNHIAEFLYTKETHTFKFLRLRADKSTPNHVSVVNAVMRLITNPVTENTLIGESVTYNRIAHNLVKKDIISNFDSSVRCILDVGSGTAQDYLKWRIKNLDVTLVECDCESMKKAKIRCKQDEYHYIFEEKKLEQLDGLDGPTIEGKKYDTITCFFALNNLYRDEETVNDFVRKVAIVGSAEIIFFDGRKILELTGSDFYEDTTFSVRVKNEGECLERKEVIGPGIPVEVRMPETTLYKIQNEFLVDPNDLIQRLLKAGLEVKVNKSICDYLSELETSPDLPLLCRPFSSLYTYFKVGSKVESNVENAIMPFNNHCAAALAEGEFDFVTFYDDLSSISVTGIRLFSYSRSNTCFLHSLFATFIGFKNFYSLTEEGKRCEIIKRFKQVLASFMAKRCKFESFPEDVRCMNDSIEDLIQLIESEDSLYGYEVVYPAEEMLKVNIEIVSSLSKRPIKRQRPLNKNRPSVFLYYIVGLGHYEPIFFATCNNEIVGRVQRK